MKKELKKLAEEWYNLSCQLNKGCIEYLSELLKKNNSSIEWEDVELPEFVSVAYDGGNHPEYASNAFSTVYGIKEEDGDIYLYTEDCDEYNISTISTYELYNICDFLDEYKKEIGIK